MGKHLKSQSLFLNSKSSSLFLEENAAVWVYSFIISQNIGGLLIWCTRSSCPKEGRKPFRLVWVQTAAGVQTGKCLYCPLLKISKKTWGFWKHRSGTWLPWPSPHGFGAQSGVAGGRCLGAWLKMCLAGAYSLCTQCWTVAVYKKAEGISNRKRPEEGWGSCRPETKNKVQGLACAPLVLKAAAL